MPAIAGWWPTARRPCARSSIPEAADAQARKDQAAKIAKLGGREAILAKGSFGYSPVPGTKPVYN